jgi:5'-methylthioadenosine phosphorylase
VSVEAVLAVLKRNIGLAKAVARRVAENMPDVSESPARRALANAVMTAPSVISEEARARLSWLLGAKAT